MQGAEAEAGRFTLTYLYWGRRGALPRLTLSLAEAAVARSDIELHVSIAYQNELFPHYSWLGDRLLPIDTFASAMGVLRAAPVLLPRLKGVRRQLQERGMHAVVVLMPHLWTPLLAPGLKAAGMAYIVVVHDAAAHAGDLTGLANRWLLRDLRYADRVITLSRSVTRALIADGRASAERIDTLFHPDIVYGEMGQRSGAERDAAPLRVLFFGRIQRYKGLPVFVEALELLARRGVPVAAGVFGSGDLGAAGRRLRALGTEVENRWIDDSEVPAILARYDAMVLSHTGASQSGVAAVAFGAGMPVVATPVGGLVEQIAHEKTGLLAERVDAAALAEAIERLARDRVLFRSLAAEIGIRRGERSMAAFVDRTVEIARRTSDATCRARKR